VMEFASAMSDAAGRPWGKRSGAAVAATLQLNVDVPPADGTGRPGRGADADAHARQARDGAAVGAHEVWMLGLPRTLALPELEAPDVIAQIGP